MPWRMGVFMLGGTPYEGLMDEVRLFDGALTPSWIEALRNCGEFKNRFHTSGAKDGYFVPIGRSELITDREGSLENRKERFGAAQLAYSGGDCAMGDLHGSAMPESYRLSMEVELPRTDQDIVLAAGPTVLMEQVGPVETTQEGYWIALSNDGRVTVRLMRERERSLAEWRIPGGFDAARVHELAVIVQGYALTVEVAGTRVIAIQVPKTGGRAAGVAFSTGGTPLHNLPQRVRAVRLAAN